MRGLWLQRTCINSRACKAFGSRGHALIAGHARPLAPEDEREGEPSMSCPQASIQSGCKAFGSRGHASKTGHARPSAAEGKREGKPDMPRQHASITGHASV
eukprot:1156160-Pelagomonas_calceolata.AAC.1